MAVCIKASQATSNWQYWRISTGVISALFRSRPPSPLELIAGRLRPGRIAAELSQPPIFLVFHPYMHGYRFGQSAGNAFLVSDGPKYRCIASSIAVITAGAGFMALISMKLPGRSATARPGNGHYLTRSAGAALPCAGQIPEFIRKSTPDVPGDLTGWNIPPPTKPAWLMVWCGARKGGFGSGVAWEHMRWRMR